MSYAALFGYGAMLRRRRAALGKVSIDALARAADRAPTREQILAGNAKLGHLTISGLDISIENPEGSTRTDQNNDPPKWSQRITDAHYGYVKGTVGNDGDHVDVFVKPGTQHDHDGPVFVVDQVDKDGKFDEHKCLIGYATEQEAIDAYRANYPKGFNVGKVSELTFDAFKQWLRDGDTTRTLARAFRAFALRKYDEEEARDEHGRCTGGTSAIQYNADKKEWSKGNGKKLSAKDSARLAEAKVPPGWHDVHLNPDAKGALQVIGRDDKGRLQSRYSAEHSAQAAAEKFARLKDFNTALPKIREAIARDMKKSDEARVLSIIDKTGFRVGSTGDTGGRVKAYGISTLEGQHVTVSGDKVSLSFIGKAGKLNEQSFSDKRIAATIKSIGATRGQRLFNTDDEKIRTYLHTISGDQFKTKDFRTWHGTRTALDAIRRATPAVSERDFIRLQRDVSREVAAHLGNTPSVALKYYIDPAVWHKWGSK